MEPQNCKLGIVSLTVGHWDLMNDHIMSIYDHYPFPKEFYIVPNVDFGMSLGQAFNKGIKRALRDGCDLVCYIADDVMIGENSIQTLMSNIHDKWIVHALGTTNSAGWDFFLTTPELWTEVGFLDESFYPAYFEDNSFARRLTMKDDTKYLYLQGIEFTHLHSQTIARMTNEQKTEQHNNFRRVERMYEAMWGGKVGGETFTEPWNGNPPEEFEGLKVIPVEYWQG